jgi:translation initiation factor IF-3
MRRDRPGAEQSDTGGHISTELRINERIRVPEVRLVGPAGEQVGIVSIGDALRLAQEADLDLVEVAPMARPPVAKLMDYGKFKYESALKARESRKNQAQTVIKEIKLRPKIDPHDYGTKKGHVERFLKQGDKVKVTIMFRGREQSRPELGYKLLQRLAGDIEELGFVESSPKQDGRNMIMVIGPHKRKSDALAAAKAERASRASARAATAPAVAADADDDASQPVEAAPSAPAPAAQTAAPAERSQAASGEAAAPSPRPTAPRSTGSAPRPAPPTPRPAPPRPSAPRSAASTAARTAGAGSAGSPPKPGPARRPAQDAQPAARGKAPTRAGSAASESGKADS